MKQRDFPSDNARAAGANVRLRNTRRDDGKAGSDLWDVIISGGWNGVMVAAVQKPENKIYEGKRMDEVAKLMKRDPLAALCDLLISEDTFPSAIYFEMDEQNVRAIMREPWVGVGSDGGREPPP